MSFNKRMLSAGAAPFVPSEHFKIVTYTGNSSADDSGVTQTIKGVGFQPDFVWIKRRDGTENHYLQDSSRGSTQQIYANLSNAQYNQTNAVTSFNSDGFVLGGYNGTNNIGETYVAWCWKVNGGTSSSNSDGSATGSVQANAAAGFSIVKYTGTGSGFTLGHGLSSAPKFIMLKKYSASGDWLAGALDWNKYLEPNGDPAFRTAGVFGNTAPGDSVFTLGTSGGGNTNGADHIAYCFADVAGYQKIGSYEGTGDAEGPIVNVGFEPVFIIIKNVDSAGEWWMVDNIRGNTQLLQGQGNAAESTSDALVTFLSNGFQVTRADGNMNGNGDTFLYIAIGTDADEEAPALANSFSIQKYVGTKPNSQNIKGFGFDPGFVWIKNREADDFHSLLDTVRGQKVISTDSTSAESAFTAFDFITDGFSIANSGQANESGDNLVAYGWKANDNEPTYNTNGTINSIVSANDNAGFSIIKYTGTGSNATVGHGLSAAPTFMLVKNLSSSGAWAVYHSGMGATKYMSINETTQMSTASNVWNDTAPTSTVSSIGTWGPVNTSGDEHIMYAWTDKTGYSKFGTYTGNGSAGQSITTGFKPDFVLIKSTVGSDNWRLYDTRRGIKDGGYLEPNRDDQDDTSNAPGITTTSTGFTITSGGVTIGDNANGNLYTYYAFAQNVTANSTLANSFKVVSYVGTGVARPVSVGFQPDFIWLKQRSSTEQHYAYDTIRGPSKYIHTNLTSTEGTDASSRLSSFDADGFSLSTDAAVNGDGSSYNAWCWKAGNTWESNIDGGIPSVVNANTASGFSIVEYTATGSTATVGHGLSSAPDFIIAKVRNQTYDWLVYHSGVGEEDQMVLHDDRAQQDSSFMNDTAPTSSVFTAASGNNLNYADGNKLIAYCWHSVTGYSKFGTYSGSGSNSNAVTLGFKPDFLIVKRTNSTGGWLMFDSLRSTGNPVNDRIEANNNQAEQTDSGDKWVSFKATTFEANGSDTELNASGSTYLYAAWKMNPTINNTLANSFKTVTYTGAGGTQSITGTGFTPDLVWVKKRNSADDNAWFDAVRGPNKELLSNSDGAEADKDQAILTFDTDGFTSQGNGAINADDDTYVAWCWKAGNAWEHNLEGTQSSLINANTGNGFSIVKWKTNGSSSQTVGHGLSSTPEIIFFKRLDSSQDWYVETNAIDGSYDYGNLEQDAAFTLDDAGAWSTRATSTTITNFTSSNNFEYIAYCWHSVSGYSKIGSYTGNGSTQSITGLGFQPDWIMIKGVSSGGAGGWYVFDSERGAENYLRANVNNAEYIGAEATLTAFDSDGFSLGNDGYLNGNNYKYLYMAFKHN